MNKIIDENYLDLIISKALLNEQTSEDDITPVNQEYFLQHIPIEDVDYCNLNQKYSYYNIPKLFTLMSDLALENSGVTSVQDNPHLALYGRGTLIGIIDTGINYQHPAFLAKDKTSRIIGIWDQSIQDGPVPEGFTYGTEYTRKDLNLALKNSDPLSIVPSADENGHGTAIASIAAGSEDSDHSFRGVAPEAILVVVKLKKPKKNLRRIMFVPEDAECYQESDIMLGLRYLKVISDRLARPMSVCLALGSSQGSHTGLGALCEHISVLCLLPKFDIAVAGGNEGSLKRHFHGAVASAPYNQTVELEVGEKDSLFAVEIWSQAPAMLSLEVISPSGESTRLVYPQFQSCVVYNFIFEDSKVWINNIELERETGDQLIVIRFENARQGIWRIALANLDGEPFSFDAWLPSGNLISEDTYFLSSSPDTTVTIPGTVNDAMTVTAYDPQTGRILADAGRGYSLNNQIVPEVAAPGYKLTCAYLNGRYGELTGTGGAAAFTAGVIAMIFEWAVLDGNYTGITGNEINRLIVRGANRSDTSYQYPNQIWGYGILDVYNIFLEFT